VRTHAQAHTHTHATQPRARWRGATARTHGTVAAQATRQCASGVALDTRPRPHRARVRTPLGVLCVRRALMLAEGGFGGRAWLLSLAQRTPGATRCTCITCVGGPPVAPRQREQCTGTLTLATAPRAVHRHADPFFIFDGATHAVLLSYAPHAINSAWCGVGWVGPGVCGAGGSSADLVRAGGLVGLACGVGLWIATAPRAPCSKPLKLSREHS